MVINLIMVVGLEICVLWCTWEGDDVTDVGHAGDEEDDALKAEAEP